jgi:hypothetical protein
MSCRKNTPSGLVGVQKRNLIRGLASGGNGATVIRMDYINSAEVLRFLLFWLGGLVTFLAAFMATQALFPEFTRRCQGALNRPGRVSLLGLGGWAVVAFLSGIFFKIGPLAILAILLLSLALILSLMGSAGLARRIGSGLQSPLDKDQPWRRTLRGGWVLVGLMLVPALNVPGLLLVLLTGLGTAFTVLAEMRAENKLAAKEADVETLD